MVQNGSEEAPENEVDAGVSEIEDTEALKKALAEEKEKANRYLANWQRTQADFINFKRRSEQEKEEISKFGISVALLNLLPVLDDLDMALASTPHHLAKNSWVEGMKAVDKKLRATLEAQGLSPINALGEPFDPHIHEAIRQDKGEEGIVIGEVQKGYKFRDKVIRPSKVVVGSGEEEQPEEEKKE
jgi:molecular chaperone GrpE